MDTILPNRRITLIPKTVSLKSPYGNNYRQMQLEIAFHFLVAYFICLGVLQTLEG